MPKQQKHSQPLFILSLLFNPSGNRQNKTCFVIVLLLQKQNECYTNFCFVLSIQNHI